jgi:hypothetical protein
VLVWAVVVLVLILFLASWDRCNSSNPIVCSTVKPFLGLLSHSVLLRILLFICCEHIIHCNKLITAEVLFFSFSLLVASITPFILGIFHFDTMIKKNNSTYHLLQLIQLHATTQAPHDSIFFFELHNTS